MHFNDDFRYLFKVRTGAAYSEIKDAEINGVSIVPGFNVKRSILNLRGSKFPPKDKIYFDTNMITCTDQPAAANHPELMKLASRIVEKAGYTQIGMIILAVMHPGSIVKEHVDNGPYYSYYHRIHVALTTTDGSFLKSGATEISIKAGEAWELNNLQVHSARNVGTVPRYHLIIDAV